MPKKPHSKPFWKTKKLTEMTREEWETLCDGCGRCCLHKLQDEDTGELFYTRVVCRLFDMQTCRCTQYDQRQVLEPTCMVLTPETVLDYPWMPATCAYRLLAEGKPLKWWHPLVSGTPETVQAAGVAVRGFAILESKLQPGDCLEDYVVEDWQPYRSR